MFCQGMILVWLWKVIDFDFSWDISINGLIFKFEIRTKCVTENFVILLNKRSDVLFWNQKWCYRWFLHKYGQSYLLLIFIVTYCFWMWITDCLIGSLFVRRFDLKHLNYSSNLIILISSFLPDWKFENTIYILHLPISLKQSFRFGVQFFNM